MGCVPSLLFDLRPNYGGGNKDNGALLQKVSQCPQPRPPPETPGHSQASLSQSLVGSLLLSPGSWCTQGLFVLSKSLFWWLYGGLMMTSSKRTYAIPRPAAPRPPTPVAVHCRLVSPQETLTHSNTGLSQSLWGAQGFVRALQASLVGMAFDSKHDFVSLTILLRLLLCPWTWGIFFWWDPTFSCRMFLPVGCDFGVLAGENERMSF